MDPEEALRFVRREQGEPDGFRWRVKQGGSGDEVASWGVVIPDDNLEPFQYLPGTTPRNGRGGGEPPDYEFSVELVRRTDAGAAA